MSAQRLEQWAAKFVQTFPLSILKDSIVGIDASYYLEQRLNETKAEPLKSALGGVPFALRSAVEEELEVAQKAGVTLIFVFNGLDYVNKPAATTPVAALASVKAHDDGWKHYSAGDATTSVEDFGRAKYPTDILHGYLRKILRENNVQYLIAPYSSVAQLSYLQKCSAQHIDAIMGPTDAFLFGVDKIILDIDYREQNFTWLSKSSCEERLGRLNGDMFRDAQLLLGSAFLPTFPILERASHTSRPSIQDAFNLLKGFGGSVMQLCNHYRDDPSIQSLEYADKYKKAVMTIRHHIILETNGIVAPLDFDHAPGDVHDFVGQRLPEELFFYISRGLLGPHIPNWLTMGEIALTLPVGVIDTESYRRLVVEQLNPMRTQALKLVSESLNYYYQNREVNLRSWDNRDVSALKIELKAATPLKTRATEWRVKAADSPIEGEPSMLACVRALKNKAFAHKSITKGRLPYPALKSQAEIISNVNWRFLQIRGFVDEKHELTMAGLMLEAALSSLEGSGNDEELALVAVEMLRLGLFTTSSVTGVAVPTTDRNFKLRANTNLLSKIATIGRLQHESMGYIGPLNREVLCFAWMISAVQSALRDLFEAVLTCMFLNGDVERERDDWLELPQKLPFVSDNGAALGVATRTYLEAFLDIEPTDENKTMIKEQRDKFKWFSHAVDGLTHNLEMAFRLFDAVHAATQTAGKESRDSKVFSDADNWLAPLR